MKPVGQMWVNAEEEGESGTATRVDKDVVLAKRHFDLKDRYENMSPVIIPRGATKEYLDGKGGILETDDVRSRIKRAYEEIGSANGGNVVVEGTGHCGYVRSIDSTRIESDNMKMLVLKRMNNARIFSLSLFFLTFLDRVGSVVGWNNARVASLLGIKVVLIANGGIGSSFDELNLNRSMCLQEGVPIAGVIVNKVAVDKVEQTRSYLEKAMAHFDWNVPLLGVVPDGEMLDTPTALDLSILFGTKIVSTTEPDVALRAFTKFELVTTSLEKFLEKLHRMNSQSHRREGDGLRTAFVTHRTRTDIIQSLLAFASKRGPSTMHGKDSELFRCGLVLSGDAQFDTFPTYMEELLKDANIPIVPSGLSSAKTIRAIDKFTPKLNANDTSRVKSVIDLYSPYIDTERLVDELSR